jgi:hypothetical protein
VAKGRNWLYLYPVSLQTSSIDMWGTLTSGEKLEPHTDRCGVFLVTAYLAHDGAGDA